MKPGFFWLPVLFLAFFAQEPLYAQSLPPDWDNAWNKQRYHRLLDFSVELAAAGDEETAIRCYGYAGAYAYDQAIYNPGRQGSGLRWNAGLAGLERMSQVYDRLATMGLSESTMRQLKHWRDQSFVGINFIRSQAAPYIGGAWGYGFQGNQGRVDVTMSGRRMYASVTLSNGVTIKHVGDYDGNGRFVGTFNISQTTAGSPSSGRFELDISGFLQNQWAPQSDELVVPGIYHWPRGQTTFAWRRIYPG